MSNVQLETLLQESGMDLEDQEQVRRIFQVLTTDRQIRILDRKRFERIVANVRRSRERLEQERAALVRTLVDDFRDELAAYDAKSKNK